MILYLYGVAGAGKNYIGEKLASDYQFEFHDADKWLSPELLSEFKRLGSFTQELRNKFHEIIASKIQDFDRSKNIVIAQASIKNINRQQIIDANPDVHLIWVKSDIETLVARVSARANFVSVENVKTMLNNFDAPDKDALLINNDPTSPISIADQLSNIIKICTEQTASIKSRPPSPKLQLHS